MDPRVFQADRFLRPDLGIALCPTFRFGRDDRLFLLGNCFANVLEAKLVDAGWNAGGGGLGPAYSIESIYQAVKWSLRGGFEDRHLIEVERDGRPAWFNPHRAPEAVHGSREEAAAEYCSALQDAGAGLRKASVLIVVLGVVEHFTDRQTGLSMNCLPQAFWWLRRSGRAQTRRDGHREVVNGALSAAYEVLAANRGIRMIWGVSPIMQEATVFGRDALVENGYGKAVLRCAVEEVVERLRGQGVLADYFPFYELGTLNPRPEVYQQEQPGRTYGRMVRSRFVRELVVPMLTEAYSDQAGMRERPPVKISEPAAGL